MQAKFLRFIFGPLLRYGISHKLQATALWSMLEAFSSPLFSLLLIPIFTHNLGLENYGLYVMVMAFVSFFGFTGLGMNTSITYYLAVNCEMSNPKHTAERLGSALAITFFGTAVFSCLFLLAFNLFTSPIKTYYPQLIAHQQLVYAALVLIVITQLDMVVSASLKGLQKFEISSKVEFLLRLFSFVVVALFVITQKNIVTIILVTLIMSLFNLIIRYVTLKKIVNFHFSDIKINKQGANELFHFGKWMTLQNISGAIFNSLDKLLLGFYFNTTVVGLYNIVISVTQLPHFILASASSFLMSKITANTANFQILRQYYYKSLVASASLVIIMLLILATMYPYLASHFNLAKIKYEYFVMLISYGVLAMCVSPYNFALGLGRFKLLSVVNTISSLVGIILVVVLVNSHGIVGAVASRVFYTMIVSLVFFLPPILFKKTIDNIN